MLGRAQITPIGAGTLTHLYAKHSQQLGPLAGGTGWTPGGLVTSPAVTSPMQAGPCGGRPASGPAGPRPGPARTGPTREGARRLGRRRPGAGRGKENSDVEFKKVWRLWDKIKCSSRIPAFLPMVIKLTCVCVWGGEV